ncbi:unnamed protein product [Cyprideis torosa]|uniref:Sugar phosphate phosphatase n=1 Tax=Cyprideis torosa TaxID=163714 RepID=A0A7R8ZNY1_9CRUS|nr:unnamed protein product [Cyprideis torosa]CAG0887395.1 unnamed protein product [Cyprideis torosa]
MSATPIILSGSVEGSFPYLTLKDRKPVILTRIVDYLSRHKGLLAERYGEESMEEIKLLTESIAQLKYELVTDKPMKPLVNDVLGDMKLWNQVLEEGTEEKTFFSVQWLLADALWGNQFDLSLSSGSVSSEKMSDQQCHAHRRDDIVINELDAAVRFVKTFRECPSPGIIRYVLDNAGLELFWDLVLADYLLTQGFCSQVIFYPKAIPWFVSDVLKEDIDWLLDHGSLRDLGKRWKRNFQEGRFKVCVNKFFTLPHAFMDMKTVAPELYNELASSAMIVFKGDLNYRKLLGDCSWDPPTVPFACALRGFNPAPFLVLRTCKAPLIAGIGSMSLYRELKEADPNWLVKDTIFGKFLFLKKMK